MRVCFIVIEKRSDDHNTTNNKQLTTITMIANTRQWGGEGYVRRVGGLHVRCASATYMHRAVVARFACARNI